MRVKVSNATKREFKKNKEYYKSQGIKSSIGLQKYKNELRKIKRVQNKNEREAIKEAYNLESEKFEAIGYSSHDFLDFLKKIQKYNEKIEKSKKSGYISATTPTLNFPINQATGKINLKRLSRVLEYTQRSIRDIGISQRRTLFNNIKEVYGADIEQYARSRWNKIPLGYIFEKLKEYELIDFLVLYDIKEFDENARDFYWKPLYNKLNELVYAIDDIADEWEGGKLW